MSAFVERMQQLVVYHRHARFLRVVENARPLRRCPYCGERCPVDDGACAGHLDLLDLDRRLHGVKS